MLAHPASKYRGRLEPPKECMKIITQTEKIVKTTTTNTTIVEYEETAAEREFRKKYGQKWHEKKQKAAIIAQKMRKIGEINRAIRMENCSDYVKMETCNQCGTSHLVRANLCRDRFCPVCKWRLSMKRFATMIGIVEALRRGYPESSWQFVTLTVKNCRPENLPETMDEMSRIWNSIASSKKFKAKVAGWARSTEITYNTKTKEVHPHYHVLVMYEELTEPDEYIINRWMQGIRLTVDRKAQDASQLEFTCDENREIGWAVDDNPDDEAAIEAILETFKYATKDAEIENMPLGVFHSLVKVINKRRLIAFGGKIKEYAKLLEAGNLEELGDGEERDEETKLDRCIHCGSKDLVEVVGKWAGNNYIWRRAED